MTDNLVGICGDSYSVMCMNEQHNKFLFFIHVCEGVFLDTRVARRYGCQLREVLRTATGQHPFLRPGDFWHRNVEHRKGMDEPLSNVFDVHHMYFIFCANSTPHHSV
jgi:hypothetical protein